MGVAKQLERLASPEIVTIMRSMIVLEAFHIVTGLCISVAPKG